MRHFSTTLLLGLTAVCLTAVTAHAIPAFTRAHKVECTTCHTIYPALNEYGEAFLKNSYVFTGKGKKGPAVQQTEAAVKPEQLAAGATNEGLLLSAIPEQLPLSVTGVLTYAYDSSQTNQLDFSARALKLQAGGSFREMIGFFGTYLAYSEGYPNNYTVGFNTSTIPGNNDSDLSELLLSWRHILGSPLNLRAGRMQPKLGLWKSSNKISVTNNYLPYSYSAGSVSHFSIDQPQDALEINTIIGSRMYVAGGIVNRKGQNTKEGYGHLSVKFGGADYTGSEPDVDLDKEESILDFLSVSLGTYGYVGRNGTAGVKSPENSYFRTGIDAECAYKKFRLRLLGGYGEDDNPELTSPRSSVISRAGTVEAEYALLLNLIAAARFEYLEQRTAVSDGSLRRYLGILAYSPLQNVKLVLEYKHESRPTDILRIATAGATFSF